MNRRRKQTIAALLAMLPAATFGAELRLDQLPLPVRTTITREVGAGTFTGYDALASREATVYRVRFVDADTRLVRQIEVGTDGSVLARDGVRV